MLNDRDPEVAPARPRRTDERGIVAVWMAITLFLLLGVAAIAVDLVHGLLVSEQEQNAADAASLAGVIYLPDNVPGAQSTAQAVSKENGFANGVDGTTVTALQDPSSPTRLKVVIKKKVPTFFAKAIGFDTLTVTQSATADYAPPLALGSPENSLGFQPYRHVWAAISGYCSSREDGDLRAARYYGNRPPPSGNTVCPVNTPGGTATLSPQYQADGYSYIVDIRQPAGGPVALQVFDGPFRASFPGGGCDGPGLPVAPAGTPCPDSTSGYAGAHITTTFQVWDMHGTPFTDADDTLVSTTTFGTTNDTTLLNRWDTIAMLPSSVDSYRVKVSTLANEPDSVGSNGWALGARVGGTTGFTTLALPRCVNDVNETAPGVTYSAGCPKIYAEKEMSLFANESGSTATFYLAEIAKAYKGQTLIISLFDPGEGGQTLQVLDPSGNPVSFTWQTVDPETGWPQYSGSGTSLDISQRLGTPLLNHASDYKFSDRRLELTMKIPSNYNPATTDWWKLKYQFSITDPVHDRTTWGARIIGNPVRLVQ